MKLEIGFKYSTHMAIKCCKQSPQITVSALFLPLVIREIWFNRTSFVRISLVSLIWCKVEKKAFLMPHDKISFVHAAIVPRMCLVIIWRLRRLPVFSFFLTRPESWNVAADGTLFLALKHFFNMWASVGSSTSCKAFQIFFCPLHYHTHSHN